MSAIGVLCDLCECGVGLLCCGWGWWLRRFGLVWFCGRSVCILDVPTWTRAADTETWVRLPAMTESAILRVATDDRLGRVGFSLALREGSRWSASTWRDTTAVRWRGEVTGMCTLKLEGFPSSSCSDPCERQEPSTRGKTRGLSQTRYSPFPSHPNHSETSLHKYEP